MSRRGRRGAFLGSAGRVGIARWSALYGAAPSDVMLIIDQPVLLDIDALVHGLEIEGNGELIFDPNASRLLQVDQQRPVCIMDGGHLEMVPASASITHEIRFINVDEDLYTIGGGMNHTANPGLCVENATVTLRGATKTGWTRATGALAAGATTCTVVSATGWRIGDEIVITPTEAASVANHYNHFDRRTLTNVVGNTLTFAATTYPHPSNTTPSGTVIYPEVLNLTRNVVISGQDATHRAQIMFMEECTGSILEYFEGKFVGPRKLQPGSPAPQLILGRYALHFHLMAEGSRDLNVTGVVMHDCGSRGFVPHGSHGMTFTDCVAWDVYSEGYWWDSSEDLLIDESNDLLYDRCFAGRVRFSDANPGGASNSGFLLAAGTNMTVRNCCVAAIPGSTDTSGYHWPSQLNGNPHNVWTFEDNDSHNNDQHGIFIWQNDGNNHTLTRVRCWNNDIHGIKGGAYLNNYHYDDCEAWGNNGSDFMLAAQSWDPAPSRRMEVNRGHIPRFLIGHHNLDGQQRSVVRDVVIAHVRVGEIQNQSPGTIDFINCGIDDTDFEITYMHTGSMYRVQLGASAWQITTTTGTDKVVTPIALFA